MDEPSATDIFVALKAGGVDGCVGGAGGALRWHTGYSPRPEDHHDIPRLCDRFGLSAHRRSAPDMTMHFHRPSCECCAYALSLLRVWLLLG